MPLYRLTYLFTFIFCKAHPSFAAAAISVSTDLLILMSLLFHVLGKWQRRLKTSMKKAFVVADIPLEAIVEWTTNISLRCLRSRDSPSISEVSMSLLLCTDIEPLSLLYRIAGYFQCKNFEKSTNFPMV